MNRGLKPVSNRRDDVMARVKWDRLEALLAEYYRARGYAVDHCGTGGSRNKFDGGVDLRLCRGEERLLVQCKHWNAYKVAHNDVHQLLGLVVNEEATGGILATSGEFTKAAIEAAARQGRIELIDGDELRAMLGPLPDEQEREVGAGPSASVAAGAADRLVTGAEDRIRGNAGKHRGIAESPSSALMLFGLKVSAVGLLVWLLVGAIEKVFDNFEKGLLSQSRQTSTPAANPLPAPQEASAALDVPTQDVSDGLRDRGVAQVGSDDTESQRRERRRRNAEAMRVLEATTPEVLLAPPTTHQERWRSERVGADGNQ